MNKVQITNMFNSMRRSLIKHSPEILTGIGIAGMISTTVLAVQATPKALKAIEKEKRERNINGKLKPIDTVKATWKYYIPAAITGTASIVCLVGASSVSYKRNAALATAYTLSEKALYEYREQVVDTMGEKKEREIHDKVAAKQIKENPVENSEVILTNAGNSLFYDPMSGRYFMSSIEKIKSAEIKLNTNMLHSIIGYSSLNDFYDEINLSHTDIGDLVGWSTTNLIDIDISPQLTDDKKPCVALVYFNRPDYNYDMT